MPDPTPPSTKPTPPPSRSELSPRQLAKLKIEIEGYELIKRLDAGGQATVYKAIQKQDGKVVAIKVLHGGPHATDEARARMKREINALRAINHPNIVQAIAAGRTRSGLDCLVMNFIDGQPLDALWTDAAFATAVAPQPADLLRLFKTICDTVQTAHRKGITHRDLSPSNILIDAHGQPHILDFGMASTAFDGIVTRDISMTGQFIGKLQYASPEQARGSRTPAAKGQGACASVDIRSDVYALGIILYQLLTSGAFPYEVVGNLVDVLNNIIYSAPKPPSQHVANGHTPAAPGAEGASGNGTLQVSAQPAPAPPGSSAAVRRNPPLVNETIEAIVLKSLEKDPAQRYQSAGELAADIDRYLAGQPTSAVVWSKRPTPASSSFPLRRAAIVAASVALVAVLVGVSMNAQSLAVWLGLATAAAPVLPTDLSPIAPSSAEAAMLLQAADAEGSQDQLNRMAKELAFTDARLSAVLAKLRDSFGIKSPELQDGAAASSLPIGVDAYTAALAAFSEQTGRTLTFTLPASDAREAQKLGEEERFARAGDEGQVKARRDKLQTQQAALWAQLAWGTFTGRDDDALYLNRTRAAADANDNARQQQRVMDAGVKLQRIAAHTMNQASIAAKASTSEVENAAPDLATLTSSVAQPVGDAVKDFLTAITDARTKGKFSEAELKSMQELRSIAEALRGAATNSGTAATNIASAQDEVARSSHRADLQSDLRATGEQAAKLDQALLAAQKAWNVEVDPASKLGPVVPVVRRPQPPARKEPRPQPQRAADNADPIDLLEVGDGWQGTLTDGNGVHQASAVIDSIKGNTVVFRINPDFGPYGFTIVLDGTRATAVSYVSYQRDPSTFKITKSTGSLENGRLLLDIEGTRIPKKGPQGPGWWKIDIKTLKPRAAKPAVEPADPAARVTV
ncbi:MAG: serine/threonine protein kinase, partial [Phycisphaerales bacterium]|nr:serine/threonine protein kinase [Phycisphaerales bacterium]